MQIPLFRKKKNKERKQSVLYPERKRNNQVSGHAIFEIMKFV
jgi:hypothetical protein